MKNSASRVLKTNLKPGKSIKAVFLYILLLILSFIFLFPVFWMIISSFKLPDELLSWPSSLFGNNPTLSNFINVLTAGNFAVYFRNTVFVSVTATLLTVVVNLMSGYAFAKYQFRFKNVLFAAILATMMVPLEVIMIPVFRVIVIANLANNLWGLIIPAIASPAAIFLVCQYYKGISNDFIEAARIDGASEFDIFLKVMLPMATPLIAVLCILSFMWRWNDYLWPLLVIFSRNNFTIQLALGNYSADFNMSWNLLLAMSSLSIIPVILIFIVLQKFIIGGITTGGVKG